MPAAVGVFGLPACLLSTLWCRCGGGKLVDGGLLEYERIKRKTLVFVGGAHYSGTSLLEAVLSTSPLTSVRVFDLPLPPYRVVRPWPWPV
jgi:hypothetical protein